MHPTDNAAAERRSKRGAVLFDMDGTIVHMLLDFDDIRREIGIPAGPVLEAIADWTGPQRQRAEAILLRREMQTAEMCRLLPDTPAVLSGLRRRGWGIALLTRNCRSATELVLRRHALVFDAVHTREDGAIKPAPEPVYAVCRSLGVSPKDSWVVGDYLFDLRSGRAAGARTVLLLGPKAQAEWTHMADHVIERLGELLPIIDDHTREGIP